MKVDLVDVLSLSLYPITPMVKVKYLYIGPTEQSERFNL